jgi:hypothetical protein
MVPESARRHERDKAGMDVYNTPRRVQTFLSIFQARHGSLKLLILGHKEGSDILRYMELGLGQRNQRKEGD